MEDARRSSRTFASSTRRTCRSGPRRSWMGGRHVNITRADATRMRYAHYLVWVADLVQAQEEGEEGDDGYDYDTGLLCVQELLDVAASPLQKTGLSEQWTRAFAKTAHWVLKYILDMLIVLEAVVHNVLRLVGDALAQFDSLSHGEGGWGRGKRLCSEFESELGKDHRVVALRRPFPRSHAQLCGVVELQPLPRSHRPLR